jgi:hypothetical protein
LIFEGNKFYIGSIFVRVENLFIRLVGN